MIITDRALRPEPLAQTVAAALEGGATAVQLREPDLSARELFDLASQLRPITRSHNALLIINDRIDVALAARADGVHLGWRSLAIEQARAIIGGEMLLGFSAHNLDEARRAQQANADYITLSPVFPTPSKQGLVPVLGLDQFRAIAKQVSLPVIGLGGIDVENARGVIEAGADGIALIRGILAQADPQAAAARIAASLDK